MENKKDFVSLKQIEERLSSTKRVYKNTTRANKYGTDTQRGINPSIEFNYHSAVKRIKELFTILPNKCDRVMVILDQKQEPLNASDLYCIVTSTFFFHIQCDVLNNYKVEYLFYRCPLEEQIMKIIGEELLKSYSTEKVQQDDFPAFFKRVLSVQPERFIHLLDYKP